MTKQEYLESLTQADLFSIIKYGLRSDERAPFNVTVEDIYSLLSINYEAQVYHYQILLKYV